jgi:class 3 adenylate cyclase
VPSVLAKEGPLAGRRLQVDAALTFGRGQADVVVDDLELSRRHAVLRAGEDFFEIEDLDSLNGTWVNGSRISGTVQLEPGDVIRLGKTVLEVVAQPRPVPRVPAPEAPAVPSGGPGDARSSSSVEVVPVEQGRCSECNAEVSSQSRFCSYCGAALRGDRPRTSSGVQLVIPKPGVEAARVQSIPGVASADELRPMTALFADVVGSTALGERLAPDEVKSLIGECVNRIAAAVEQFGGTVQAYMGDGIAAFFGLPAAHEDDPDRAAHAALRVLEVVAEYAVDISAAWGVTDFNVRVGVNSGQTAVGVVGAADRQQVALGDATNVAARLQSIAAPGTAVVGESTARRLAHRFVLESLGEVEVKGRTEPVGAWRLVRFQTGTRVPAPAPLVGRESAVAQLRSAVDDVVEGRGQVLLLMGDAGFGKTRLLRELETVAGDRVTWLEGQCRSYGGELLYWPFVEVLRRWIGVEAGEPEVSVRTKLRAKVASLGSLDPAEVLPGLARLLSIRVDAETESRRQPEPEAAPEAGIQEAVCAWIEALSKRQPVVLAIDDFQWADPQARELAEALLRVTDRAPLLFATALRADPSSEGWRFRLNALEHFSHRIGELTLGPLSDSAAEELLAMLVPEGLDDAARQEVVSRAEGNPLYLEELLRSLIEGGELERLHRTWALTSVPGKSLPPALEGLLMARFDRLPERARRLAQIAAVVGRTFPADVLAPLGGKDLDDALSVLLRAQFIRELHRYPQLVYSFKHGLLQEAVLSTLTAARREELYGRVAAVYEETYADSREEYLELLAYYYARSRNLPKACEYLELAGVRAASLNATTQALELWERARKLAAKLDDPAAESRIAARAAELDGSP